MKGQRRQEKGGRIKGSPNNGDAARVAEEERVEQEGLAQAGEEQVEGAGIGALLRVVRVWCEARGRGGREGERRGVIRIVV